LKKVLEQKANAENFCLTLVSHELGPAMIEQYKKHKTLMEKGYQTFLYYQTPVSLSQLGCGCVNRS
jgi:hypothetical protein